MSVARHHAEWLSLVEVSGPFLSMPVLLRIFPDGLDRFADERDRKSRLHVGNEEWLDSQTGAGGDPSIHRAWVRHVLREVLEFDDALLLEGQSIPPSLSVTLAEHGERLSPDYVLIDPEGRPSAGKPRVLISVVPKSQGLDAALLGHRWKASPATRMMTLLHGTQETVRIGLVTNGEHWMLVHAKPGDTTSYVSFYASLWFEEPLTLQALHSLVGARRLFGVADAETLEALFAESGQNQQEVTDQLGVQVRRAVEVLIQTIDRIDRDRGRTLLRGIDEKQLYESAVTVMMRLVFLFAAEERKLLLLGDPLYDQYYAVSTLREQLQTVADAHGEEVLQRRYDAWSRLLAAFRAVHGGVQHESMRLPAYGGSLFDPDRFPFLEGRAPGTKYTQALAQPLAIDNLTVLDLLNSLQLLAVKVPGGGPAETRRLSFRALGVEQIGHVYEGLLDHTAKRAKGPVVSLRGSKNLEPEIELEELERRRAQGQREQLVSYLAEETGRSASAIQRGFEYKIDDQAARHFLTACDNDGTLYGRVADWAGLIREDAHGKPVIFPAGSVYVTEGTARRSTGTHYTPRSLTEPIVQYTLEPLVYEGPAQGWPRDKWKLKAAKEILALRVCDLAMGSGAFLVQACRYLSERIVEAWEGAEKEAGGRLIITPNGELSNADPGERSLAVDTEERLAIARRCVADSCLYGVDINPMAVEMAKLSLWLVTLQKDRPFTFVDHALKCGDSLLGVTKIEQVENFTLCEGKMQGLFATAGLRQVVEEAAQKRRELEALPSDHYDQIEQKRKLHYEAELATQVVRAIADLLTAFELRVEVRDYDAARGAAAERIRAVLKANELTHLVGMARIELKQRRTFHWALEFPEVLSRGGFDAFLGNPPYLGGPKITGALGTDYRAFLVRLLANERTGLADLCTYFVLRAAVLTSTMGTCGFAATSAIAEGDTRVVGLSQLVDKGWVIFRATNRARWPGTANVTYSSIWLYHGTWRGSHVLGEDEVAGITTLLSPQESISGTPFRLSENAEKSFNGVKVYGNGFVLTPEEAAALIAKDPRNRSVLFPYITAQDVNSHPTHCASAWAIKFFEFPLNRSSAPVGYEGPVASDFPDCLAIVEQRVMPERTRRDDNGEFVLSDPLPRLWWQYFRRCPALYSAIANMKRIMGVATQATKYVAFAFLPPDQVFSHSLSIIASDSHEMFAVLNSSIHEVWSRLYGSYNLALLRYSPSDLFETFPFPRDIEKLAQIGLLYDEVRRSTMLARKEGLTDIYNRFHSPSESSDDIVRMRDLHQELDTKVTAVYGWPDISLGHGFHETQQGIRYTLGGSARRTILGRLLSLNHERHEEDVRARLHDKGKSKAKPVRPTAKPVADKQPSSAQLGFAALNTPAVGSKPVVPAPVGTPTLDEHAAALFRVLQSAYGPLGKSALIEMAKIPDSAWASAIQSLKSQGLVEQHGEKRNTTYARKRS